LPWQLTISTWSEISRLRSKPGLAIYFPNAIFGLFETTDGIIFFVKHFEQLGKSGHVKDLFDVRLQAGQTHIAGPFFGFLQTGQ
jgi:hypothetical protein